MSAARRSQETSEDRRQETIDKITDSCAYTKSLCNTRRLAPIYLSLTRNHSGVKGITCGCEQVYSCFEKGKSSRDAQCAGYHILKLTKTSKLLPEHHGAKTCFIHLLCHPIVTILRCILYKVPSVVPLRGVPSS